MNHLAIDAVDNEAEMRKTYRLSPVVFVGPLIQALVVTALILWFNLGNLAPLYQAIHAIFGPAIYDGFARSYPRLVTYGWVVAIFFVWLVAMSFVRVYIRYCTTELRVFADRVQWRFGFIRRDVMTAAIEEVIGVQLVQTVLGRILGYGRLIINTRGDDQIIASMIGDAPTASQEIMALKYER